MGVGIGTGSKLGYIGLFVNVIASFQVWNLNQSWEYQSGESLLETNLGEVIHPQGLKKEALQRQDKEIHS